MATAIRGSNPDQTNRRILIGALILAGIAAVLVFFALSSFGGSDSTGPGQGFDVVVAANDIEAGHEVDSGDLTIATLPQGAVIDQALTDKAPAIGQAAVAKVLKGEQISLAKLGHPVDGPQKPGGAIPADKVALAVDVNESSNVAGLVTPGDHVDVIVIGTMKGNNGEGAQKDVPVARTLLQDAVVYAVSDKHLKQTAQSDSSNTGDPATGVSGDVESDPSANTVTLLVKPEDEALLALATQSYKIHLALRAPGVQTTVDNPQNALIPDLQ